ncbi:MAG: Na/Pi cotransporter family protein [Clostridia bacterium]|nr:Na/Pi cotransporter family protein [Clostridia bacterium]
MDIFDLLTMIGGLCLFLFGMNLMGEALERRAGSSLERMLSKLTSGKLAGLLTGLGVTAVIQSSSATTVMVVGFVNSGLMKLGQAINVIMGANIGTTVTAWILSLSGIDGDNIFVQLLKPTSFTPILALIGIIYYMFVKDSKRRDTGVILLGFATLMFGMDIMSGAVSGLRDEAWFGDLFVMFENPILGVLAGAVLTGIIQSSSASVGILQALSSTGRVSIGASIPIIMGQNIGTCVTAMLASVGTNKNARRAALVHLSFNVIGTVICLTAYTVAMPFLTDFLAENASYTTIAVAHSAFNIICTCILFPMSSLLEKLAYKLIPEGKTPETVNVLDERLLTTPAVALERIREVTTEMGKNSIEALKESIASYTRYTPELAARVKELEEKSDHYEDILGSYIVKLTSKQLDEHASLESTEYMKAIGDFERISDHAINILESVEELRDKKISFTPDADLELRTLFDAVEEILELSYNAFLENDSRAADNVEPLEEVIDRMKENMRSAHIARLGKGNCSIEAGFVFADLITNLERVADHCSNIAGGVLDANEGNMDIHTSLRTTRTNPLYEEKLDEYSKKYLLA